MSRKRIVYLSIGLVAIALLIIIGKRRNKGDIEVQTGSIAYRTIISTVSANGKVMPEGEVKISADVSGEIVDLFVEEGDTVKEGDILLKIDQDLYLTALDRARANLSAAQSSYKTNLAILEQSDSRFKEQEANFARSQSLFDQGVLSQAEFDAASTAYQVATSDVKAAKERVSAAQFNIDNARASVSEAQKNLARTTILAPGDGVVSALNMERGERVVGTAQMAGTEIMVISNFHNMEVIVDVNENDILQVKHGDTTDIEVDAYPDRIFKGIVTEIARSASGLGSPLAATEQVTNFEVKIRILKSSYEDLMNNNIAPFLPGMSAGVEIQTKVEREVACLPIEAVTTRESTDSSTTDEIEEVVFGVKNGKAVRYSIKTGIQDSRYIQIVSGLDSSATIVTGPYDAVSKKLKDGKVVKVVKGGKDWKEN